MPPENCQVGGGSSIDHIGPLMATTTASTNTFIVSETTCFSMSTTSSSRPDIDPDELVVKAEYFLRIEPGEDNLRKIKSQFRNILQHDGFYQTDDELSFIGPTQRAMTFHYHIDLPEPPLYWRVKKALGLTANGRVPNYQRDYVKSTIENRVEDLPFEIEIRFRTVTLDGDEGYEATAVATPTLFQQYRQRMLTVDSEYDVKTAVSSTKRELSRLFAKIEAQPLRRPYTESELIESRLEQRHRDALAQWKHGNTALQYLNEGEICLKQGLLNAALNCYILCIEWVIIVHLAREGRRDVIAEEKESGGDYYWELVDELEEDKLVSKKTYEKLSSLNSVERRWAAHHKDGEIVETDVANVKDRLEILITELFPRSD